MSGRTLGWYGACLRSHGLLVLVLTVAATVLGAVVSLAQPVVYQSTAVVVATPQPPPGSGREGLRRAPTVDSDSRLLSSDRVLANVAEDVGYPGGIRALRENVDVTARATSRVLRVRVTADSPDTAQQTANAIAADFLRLRSVADDTRFEAAREVLTAQIERLTEQLAAAAAAGRSTTGGDAQVVELQQELTRLQAELTSTRANIEASGFVAEPAALPVQGTRPHATTTTASGAVLGLALGAWVAVASGAALARGGGW